MINDLTSYANDLIQSVRDIWSFITSDPKVVFALLGSLMLVIAIVLALDDFTRY